MMFGLADYDEKTQETKKTQLQTIFIWSWRESIIFFFWRVGESILAKSNVRDVKQCFYNQSSDRTDCLTNLWFDQKLIHITIIIFY